MKKLYVKFELSIPNKGSWNGKWTGTEDSHIKTRMITQEQLTILLESQPYFYSWNDGWGALISVKQIDSKERTKLEKKQYGFAGYDWMIPSILTHNKITTTDH